MRLDELYKMTAFIYQEPNMSRSREATFLHFVEVCALLTEVARNKNRAKIDVEGAICKTLGWYFPLLAKMRVESAEKLVFHKYPNVCPYCRENPHNEANCKLVLGADLTVDHENLDEKRVENVHKVPESLNQWQSMFAHIYPRNLNTGNFSTIAIFEELGEIAEAIRVFDRHPHYFYGEAADIFSYIMGFANEHALKLKMDGEEFDLESAFLSRYPGLCINCGSRSCVCPPIPSATIGRMTKESPVSVEEMSISDLDQFYADGDEVSLSAFSIAGNDTQLSTHLPVDRGDLNAVLIQLCLRLSIAVRESDAELSETLRSEAVALSTKKSGRGTTKSAGDPNTLLINLRKAWGHIDETVRNEIRLDNVDADNFSRIFDKRILIVSANTDQGQTEFLRLDKEQRAIKNAIRSANGEHRYFIEPLTACTIDDFRRALLEHQFDIIHFSGHASEEGLEFCKEDSGSETLQMTSLGDLLSKQENLECLILNACDSMLGIEEPLHTVVIGMMDEIDDEAAIEFAKGFYDALAAGKTVDDGFQEGVANCKARSLATEHIAKLRNK